MNRLYAYAGVLLVIIVLYFTSCSLYKGKVAASVKADIATKVVTEAMAESKVRVTRDYQVQAKKRKALDSVRPIPEIKRKTNDEASESTTMGGVSSGDPSADPWYGLFNDAVRSSNRAIESTGDMP